ncbi:MAG TPA: L-iditol 2-dehydrogenase [Deinococcales bacterium]|nr:L-iditol 2-dehydrogenase [Deinococcales bacterium]
MAKLNDKVAIVTGGAQGIGRAISRRLAEEGAHVAIADYNLEQAQRTAQEITAEGGRAFAVQVDVTKEDDIAAMVDTVVSRAGGIDILVNNAGVGQIKPMFEITRRDWDWIFDVNVKGLFFVLQAVAEQMVKQGRGGKIVNLASQAGRRGEALVLHYCASKATVISITQSAALALAPHKINVNAMAPGIVDTPFWEEVDRQFAKIMDLPVGEPKRRAVAGIPLGRIEQPEDVAGLAAFLSSSDCDYITGQTVNVDGGNFMS